MSQDEKEKTVAVTPSSSFKLDALLDSISKTLNGTYRVKFQRGKKDHWMILKMPKTAA